MAGRSSCRRKDWDSSEGRHPFVRPVATAPMQTKRRTAGTFSSQSSCTNLQIGILVTLRVNGSWPYFGNQQDRCRERYDGAATCHASEFLLWQMNKLLSKPLEPIWEFHERDGGENKERRAGRESEQGEIKNPPLSNYDADNVRLTT